MIWAMDDDIGCSHIWKPPKGSGVKCFKHVLACWPTTSWCRYLTAGGCRNKLVPSDPWTPRLRWSQVSNWAGLKWRRYEDYMGLQNKVQWMSRNAANNFLLILVNSTILLCFFAKCPAYLRNQIQLWWKTYRKCGGPQCDNVQDTLSERSCWTSAGASFIW